MGIKKFMKYSTFSILHILSCWIIFRYYDYMKLPSQHIQASNPPASLVKDSSHHSSSHGHCTYFGRELTPEEALEEQSLLSSITWPQTPSFSSQVPLSATSDPAHSRVTILPAVGGKRWHVGDQLEAGIQMFDFQGRPKRYGGDFLLARLHNPELEAGVAGQVVDHLNGSYSAFFPLPWKGSAQVEVMMVHPSEAVTLLRRLKREREQTIYLRGLFHSGSVSETALCSMCLPSDKKPQCNYTDLQTGEPWYCYKPEKLSCDQIIHNSKFPLKGNIATKEEVQLLKKGINRKIKMNAEDKVNVLPQETDRVRKSRVTARPSGYYYKGVWRNLGGVTVRQFNDASSISQCLKGKMVHIYGDSTGRQWYQYLETMLPGLKSVKLHNYSNRVGLLMAVDTERNILLTFRCHGSPMGFDIPFSTLRYVANELDSLTGGKNTVVVISVWAHFITWPLHIFIKRLQTIRKAVIRLLDRAPETLVVIRSGNPTAMNSLEMCLYDSDWYILNQDKILRTMFQGLNVHLVDAWGMVVSHHLPQNRNPQPPIIKNMVNVLLSLICS